MSSPLPWLILLGVLFLLLFVGPALMVLYLSRPEECLKSLAGRY